MRGPANERSDVFETAKDNSEIFMNNNPSESCDYWPSMTELARQTYSHLVAESLSYKMNIGQFGPRRQPYSPMDIALDTKEIFVPIRSRL